MHSWTLLQYSFGTLLLTVGRRCEYSHLCRTYTLGRIMDAAVDNLGRIRLIWGRLWAALSAHLVSAACHPDPGVAVLAIGHMRGLVPKLLSRAELSCFTHQVRAILATLTFGEGDCVLRAFKS